MPKAKKTSENTQSTNSVEKQSLPIETVDVKTKSSKSSKSAKTTVVESVVVSEPVATAPVVTDLTAAAVVDESVEDCENALQLQSVEYLSKLNQIGSMIASLKSEYRVLEKKWSRVLKTAQKNSSKRKRKAGTRAPSGFIKPTRISDELAKFLEKEPGTEMARTDVTREINKYIRLHNLQDKENGRKINPDSKLSTLLKINNTDILTYFNLQRFMKPHFTTNANKDVNAVLAAAVAV